MITRIVIKIESNHYKIRVAIIYTYIVRKHVFMNEDHLWRTYDCSLEMGSDFQVGSNSIEDFEKKQYFHVDSNISQIGSTSTHVLENIIN